MLYTRDGGPGAAIADPLGNPTSGRLESPQTNSRLSNAYISSYDGTTTEVTVALDRDVPATGIAPAAVTLGSGESTRTPTSVVSQPEGSAELVVAFSGTVPTGDAPDISVDGTGVPELDAGTTAVHTTRLDLAEGQNFVSVPAAAGGVPISELDTSNVDSIWYYEDGSWSSWKGEDAGPLNDFSTLEGGKGYLFEMGSADTIDVNVDNVGGSGGSEGLEPGWNLVGHWEEGTQPRSDALVSVSGSISDAIYGQDETADDLAYERVGTSDAVEPGEGYWVYVEGDSTVDYVENALTEALS